MFRNSKKTQVLEGFRRGSDGGKIVGGGLDSERDGIESVDSVSRL